MFCCGISLFVVLLLVSSGMGCFCGRLPFNACCLNSPSPTEEDHAAAAAAAAASEGFSSPRVFYSSGDDFQSASLSVPRASVIRRPTATRARPSLCRTFSEATAGAEAQAEVFEGSGADDDGSPAWKHQKTQEGDASQGPAPPLEVGGFV